MLADIEIEQAAFEKGVFDHWFMKLKK